MRAVVKGESRPSVGAVRRVKSKALVFLVRDLKRVQAVVVPCCAVGNVPWRARVVEFVGVDDAIGEGRAALIHVRVPAEHEINAVFDEQRLEDILARPADGSGGVGVTEIPRPMASDDNPRRGASVHGREILREPVGLRVPERVEGTRCIAFRTSSLIVPDKAMPEVGLGVKLNVVRHAVVEAIPEIARPVTLSARHAEVVDVAGEVGLAWHADRDVVGYVLVGVGYAAIVAVGLVVAWPDHVGLRGGDRCELIVEVV